MRARPSPRSILTHTWLIHVENKQLKDTETGPYWDAMGIKIAFLTIPGDDAKHVIGKDRHTL